MEQQQPQPQPQPIRQIQVQGTKEEEIAQLQGYPVEVAKEVETLRSFMIQFFFHFHEDSDFGSPSQQNGQQKSFTFHCNKCDQHTMYYRKPLATFQPPLCLSSPCLKQTVEYQMEIISMAEKELLDEEGYYKPKKEKIKTSPPSSPPPTIDLEQSLVANVGNAYEELAEENRSPDDSDLADLNII